MKKFFRDKRILILWVSGFLFGIIIACLKKETFLSETGILATYTLSPLQYGSVEGKKLFFYILKVRLLPLLFFMIISTTYLGAAFLTGGCLYQSISKGVFFSVYVIRYGMHGALFFFTSLLPQIICFFPGYYLFWSKGIRLCRCLYFYPEIRHEFRPIWKTCLKFLGIVFCIITGCMLESYINPLLLKRVLSCVF